MSRIRYNDANHIALLKRIFEETFPDYGGKIQSDEKYGLVLVDDIIDVDKLSCSFDVVKKLAKKLAHHYVTFSFDCHNNINLDNGIIGCRFYLWLTYRGTSSTEYPARIVNDIKEKGEFIYINYKNADGTPFYSVFYRQEIPEFFLKGDHLKNLCKTTDYTNLNWLLLQHEQPTISEADYLRWSIE